MTAKEEETKLKKKAFPFLFSFVFMSLLLCGTDGDKIKLEKNLFSPDYFKNHFFLNLGEEVGNPLLFAIESEPGEVRRKILFNAFCRPLLKKNCKSKSKTQSKKVKKKRLGSALLRGMALLTFNSIKYWIKYSKWDEDWDYKLTWEDQKIRFFTLEAHRFDSNPFGTNLSHILGAGFRYHFARYHRLNRLESLSYCLFFSLCWEYFSEWREVISVNDNIFSTIGSIPFGEPLFQVGNYFHNKRGAFNKIVGTIFSPGIALNALLDGKKRDRKVAGPEFSKPRIDVYFGQKQVFFKGEKNRSSRLFHIGSETSFNTIPGYGAPGTINRFIKDTLLSEVCVNGTFGANSLEEFDFFTKAVLFGYFSQEIKQDSPGDLKGYSLFLGGGSAFDLFKKKAIAYYDKGSYHYDFKGGEKPSQPTEFTDKLAIINIIGPVFDLLVYSGQVKLRLSVDLYGDFALVNSMALNKYSIDHDLSEPRMKTPLSHYGYYYAFGFTLFSKGSILYKNFEIDGKFKYQYYDSIEGLDRFQLDIEDDCNVTDYKLMYKISLGYSVAKTPIKVIFACEGIFRKGSIKDINHSESEIRLYTQLKYSLPL